MNEDEELLRNFEDEIVELQAFLNRFSEEHPSVMGVCVRIAFLRWYCGKLENVLVKLNGQDMNEIISGFDGMLRLLEEKGALREVFITDPQILKDLRGERR